MIDLVTLQLNKNNAFPLQNGYYLKKFYDFIKSQLLRNCY